jgi:DNA-binding IclR family transcriptional regulator
MSDNAAKYLVPGLERGLSILALFTPERPQWSLSDVAREMGVSRSSVFRLMYTLEKCGFVRRIGERQYCLGSKVLSLGFNFVSGHDVVDVSRPHLERLRDIVGASSHLGVLEGAEVIYLVRVPSRQALISNIGVGSRLPAVTTTMGRMLLCEHDAAALRALYRRAGAAAPADPERMSEDAFVEMIADDRHRGVIATSSRYEAGMTSVAAPVRDREGRIVAAINVSAPETMLALADARAQVVPHVVATARLISGALGYAAPERRGRGAALMEADRMEADRAGADSS